MLIVLEGVDGSGKTTLANFLSRILEAEVIHATRETPNDWKWFTDIMNAAKYRNIIADRFFWGQFVYQEREERHIDEYQRGLLEHKLARTGGKLIYVTAKPSDIAKRLDARRELLTKPLEDLMSAYERLTLTSVCPVIQYNTSIPSFPKPYTKF